jgi:hypothetical protein
VTLAVTGLLTLALAACTTAPVGSHNPPKGGGGKVVDLGRDIAPYVKQPGDRVVVVPNGRYRASSVNAPHPATKGPYKGWLVLKAQSRGGVVVDLSSGMWVLGEQTSRVLFVGFKFVNGSMDVQGDHIAFWYTDHSFPASEWARQGGTYRAPRLVYADEGTAENVAFYGLDGHDTGSGLLISKSTNLRVEGAHLWNFDDMGVDPKDVVHPDAIAGVAGQSKNLTVTDSWVQGRIMLIDADGSRKYGGPHQNFLFQNTWVSDSPSASFTFTSRKPAAPYGVFGRRVNVRSWGANNGKDRISIVGGNQYYSGNPFPTRVNVIDTGIVTSPPPAGAPSPAELWRRAHSYDNWTYAIR